MKNKNVLVSLLFFSVISLHAQFVDDMESYTDGQPIYEGHWTDWSCGGGCALISSSAQARSGSLSGFFVGSDTDDASPVLDLGNKFFGLWGLEFYTYIPSDKEAFMFIQGTIPIGSGEWLPSLYFNYENAYPGQGFVNYLETDEVIFNFPHDEWFHIVMNFDLSDGLSLATWQLTIDDIEVIPTGTAFTQFNGDIPTSLGGIVFVYGNDDFYMDDFYFTNNLLATNDPTLNLLGLSATPNPVSDVLHLKGTGAISEVFIYNTLGQELTTYKINSVDASIDMSSFDNGVYLVEVHTDKGKITKKIIKD